MDAREAARAAPRAVLILPVPSQTRFFKRACALRRLGFEVEVLSFERDYFPGNLKAGDYLSLGKVEAGRLGRRVWRLLGARQRVARAVAGADLVYCFGLDILLLARLAGARGRREKVVYEVGDVHRAFLGGGPRGALLRALERRLAAAASVVVATSPSYVEGYFRAQKGFGATRFHVIENRLPRDLDLPVAPPRPGRAAGLVIGYFGLLRCVGSWGLLRRLTAAGRGRFEVYLRGFNACLEGLDDPGGGGAGITFGGPYLNPQDLPEIYSRIDLGWVAHSHGEANTRWARANRFYECCYFKKPMVAQRGTVDGGAVERYGLGVLIDLADPDEAIRALLDISEEDLRTWEQNLEALPAEVYREGDEHGELVELLGFGRGPAGTR